MYVRHNLELQQLHVTSQLHAGRLSRYKNRIIHIIVNSHGTYLLGASPHALCTDNQGLSPCL
jgi:hypothetical protein